MLEVAHTTKATSLYHRDQHSAIYQTRHLGYSTRSILVYWRWHIPQRPLRYTTGQCILEKQLRYSKINSVSARFLSPARVSGHADHRRHRRARLPHEMGAVGIVWRGVLAPLPDQRAPSRPRLGDRACSATCMHVASLCWRRLLTKGTCAHAKYLCRTLLVAVTIRWQVQVYQTETMA